MSVVAVAGGTGDLGRLIVDALQETGLYEVYVMSRKTGEDKRRHISPLTGQQYSPLIQTDYSSEESLLKILEQKKVNVVISVFIMDNDAVSDAQLRLIRAADQCSSIRRFIPSEFNVEYDVGDDILPYPEKKYHMFSRRELEKATTLEYTYIYPGMLMDYFGLPRVKSVLRGLCFFVDPEHGRAILPGDGEAKMSMTFTTDVARYVALALQLDKWPRILSTVASTVTLNELCSLVEKNLGRKLDISYQPVENLLKRDVTDLQANVNYSQQQSGRFPGGLQQLRGLIADLEAGVALGAYDLSSLSGHLDLVKEFEGKAPLPKRIEELIKDAWKPV
ncbi:hypothetical protein GGR57DRAFT_464693 [Xylariaceae sp. FL1272]|nr:hypothetical protein GGR57DRAFT_464693 [Xylariaceae sp. FL1272]